MADPIRLTVLKALAAAIEEITTAGGYRHDLAGAVFRGRSVLTHDDPLPAVTINEKPVFPEELPQPSGALSRKVELELIVQGFAEEDRQNPTDPAYLLMADVTKRLATEKVKDDGFDILGLGDRVMSLDIGQGVVSPPDQIVSSTAFFWLPVTLRFGENLTE